MSDIQIRNAIDDSYHTIFEILDNVPELTGMDAGRIATLAASVVKRELNKEQGITL